MRKHIISIFLAAALLAALAVPAWADALGEPVDGWSAALTDEATLSGASFWTGRDLRTEYLLTLAPGSVAVPVAVSAEPSRAQQTLLEAAAKLEAQGLHVLGGVNGGFYTVATGEPVGLAVGNNVLLHDDEGLRAVGFRTDGTAVFGFPRLSVALRLGERQFPVAGWNRLAKQGWSVFTADCDECVSVPEGACLVTLDADDLPGLSGETMATLTSVSASDGGAVPIPDGTLLLTLPPQDADTPAQLPEGFSEGAELTLATACADGWEDVTSAVGILYPLLEDGETAPELSASAAPRTAIGVKEDGTLLLYALDGRRSGYSVGGGLTHVAARMKELGCVTAGALDGGGSTQLAAFLPGDSGLRTFNLPSEGEPRDVANYILLAVPASPTGQAKQLSMEPLHVNAVAGAAIPLTVRAADVFGFGAALPEELKFTVTEGLGEVRDGQYFAAGTGTGTVTVSGPGVQSVSIPVRVTESPEELVLYGERYGRKTEKLTLDPGYGVDLTVRAYDRHILLSGNDLCYTWQLDPAVGTVDETGRLVTGFFAAEGLLTVTAGESSVEIPIKVDTGVPFRDVASFHPYFNAIRYVYAHQIFEGTATDRFDADTVMNRGMLVTVLWRMAGKPEAEAPSGFADVEDGAWYADAVAWASETGLVMGYGDGRFGPKDDLTREQILTVLHRWAGLPDAPEGEDVPRYPDDTDAHAWALPALQWAEAAGVSVWNELAGPFPQPRAPMIRAAVADVLMRYDLLPEPEESETPDAV